MTWFHSPPGFTSIVSVVFVNPFGPHHCVMCAGSVHTFHNSSREALTTLVSMISLSVVVTTLCSSIRILSFSQSPELLLGWARKGGNESSYRHVSPSAFRFAMRLFFRL